jgi:ferric-dicitrate binding protein FerR (iron transport regulator)
MTDDYLWDPSAPSDPDVERLEHLLGRLRTTRAPDFSAAGRAAVRRYVGPRFLWPALAAAAAVALMVGGAWQTATRSGVSWQVARLSGTPRIGLRGVAGASRLAIGETLATDASSTARVDVSTVGEVTIGENTRVRLVDARDAHYQLALERGSLHAVITAPPGQFVVNTPSATATDLGCVYTLRVDEDGAGLLSVAAGWVAFEDNGRESFVPAGASSRTDPRSGPGTPSYDDADAAFRRALEIVDGEPGGDRLRDALRILVDRARERDAMTLWHLIPRVDGAERILVVDALAARVAMPAGVTRDEVMRLDRAALDGWWDALGLLDTGWWRKWKTPLAGLRK